MSFLFYAFEAYNNKLLFLYARICTAFCGYVYTYEEQGNNFSRTEEILSMNLSHKGHFLL